MHKKYTGKSLLLLGLLLSSLAASATTVGDLQQKFQQAGAGAFDSARGESLWHQQNARTNGELRSCTSCHTKDLTTRGKHKVTGKLIQPMAPSANPKRLTNLRKVEKWLKRNCKWTFGRECSPQEKGDILAYLNSQ